MDTLLASVPAAHALLTEAAGCPRFWSPTTTSRWASFVLLPSFGGCWGCCSTLLLSICSSRRPQCCKWAAAAAAAAVAVNLRGCSEAASCCGPDYNCCLVQAKTGENNSQVCFLFPFFRLTESAPNRPNTMRWNLFFSNSILINVLITNGRKIKHDFIGEVEIPMNKTLYFIHRLVVSRIWMYFKCWF